MKEKTIVTITNKDYLIGTYVTIYSLLKNGNVDDLTIHVMTDNSVNANILSEKIYEISKKTKRKIRLKIDNIDFSNINGNTIKCYEKTFSKFEIFNLKYDSFVFLDSDLVILKDISYLFETECDFAACIDAGNKNEFNTGVMVVGKKWLSKESYNFLLKSAQNNFSYRGDQDHINNLVKNNFNPLRPAFNTLKDQHRFIGSWISGVNILHYISKKPWHPYNPELHELGNLECLEIDKIWFKYLEELNFNEYIFFNNRIELIKYINKIFPDGTGVEVGVQRGEFSKSILENWNCKKLYLIDPWEEYDNYKLDLGCVSQEEHNKNFAITKKNIEQYKEKIEIIKDYSNNACRLFSEKSLDFVYLDARHDKKGIKEDIESWLPLVKDGGIIAGHDYININQPELNNVIEVKEVVDEKFNKVNYTLDGPYSSWWIKKL